MPAFYQAGGISLYHGDCRDVLAELPAGSVDLVLTDPPYGKQYVGEGRPVRKMNIRGDGARQGVRVVRQALFASLPLLAPDAHVLVFCHWESWPDFYDAICPLVPIKNALIWHKDRAQATRKWSTPAITRCCCTAPKVAGRSPAAGTVP